MQTSVDSHRLFPTQKLDLVRMESDRLVVSSAERDDASNAFNLERKCDYVLVWEERLDVHSSNAITGTVARIKKEFMSGDPQTRAAIRKSFESALESEAWLEHIDERRSNSVIVHYILVTIKNHALVKHVHRRHMKLPLIDGRDPHVDNDAIQARPTLFSDNTKLPFTRDKMAESMNCCPPVNQYYTVPIIELDLDNLTDENIANLLTFRQRQEIANYVLMTKEYVDPSSKARTVGLGCLLESKVYKAAFCPHETLKAEWDHSHGACPNLRTYLLKHWASAKKMLVYQPLDQIREYFGETVTFYFAWLGYYTFWLVPAALIGLIVFIVGIFYSMNDDYADQICQTNLTLCPLCEVRCSAQNLSSQCVNSRVSRVFDYPGSVAYSLFMTLWAVIYLEFWKRRTCRLACEWDVLDYQSAEEPPRPEIINYQLTHVKRSQTRQKRVKLLKMAMSIVAICILIVIVLATVIATILYRLWIRLVLVENFGLVTFGTFFASISAAILSCIFMLIFAPLYRMIATKLTDLEMHEHQSSYEHSLALKLFCFSFVNFFSSTLYVAFFMGRFMGVPGKLERWFGVIPPEACTGQDCVFDLTKHILTFIAMKLTVENINEHAVPRISIWLKKCLKKRKEQDDDEIVEVRNTMAMTDISENVNAANDQRVVQIKEDLEKEPYDTNLLFGEYLEMVLQFGFVVMFGAACPLIALLALINNMVELRLDAKKLVQSKRRPVASRAQNIGVWEQALTAMVFISILTNGAYIAFTTDFLQRLIYRYEYSTNNTMSGYLEFKLVNDTYIADAYLTNGTAVPGNVTTCYYFAEKSNPKFDYYYFLAIRLSFVLMFENLAVILVQILRYIIPNEPGEVRAYLAKECEELDRWHKRHGSRVPQPSPRAYR